MTINSNTNANHNENNDEDDNDNNTSNNNDAHDNIMTGSIRRARPPGAESGGAVEEARRAATRESPMYVCVCVCIYIYIYI